MPYYPPSLPKSLLSALQNGNSEATKIVLEILERDPNIRFDLKYGLWPVGVNTTIEPIIKSTLCHKKYCTKYQMCYTRKTIYFPGQPKKAFDALRYER